MGELVEMKWEMSLRQKVGMILRALWIGSMLILILAVAVAVAKQWWWVLGSALAIFTLGFVLVMFMFEFIRKKDALYPDARKVKRAHKQGFRTCTIEFGEAGGATTRITGELLYVDQLGRFVELFVQRNERMLGMRHHLALDISRWNFDVEEGVIVLARVEPDEPRFTGLTPGLVSLRLTHAQVH